MQIKGLQVRTVPLTNIGFRDIRKYQRPLRLVIGQAERMSDQLVHGCDTTTAGNTESSVKLVRLVFVLGVGPLEQ